MADRLETEFRFHQSALALRADRQQLLASNIANADTPHFKARDIDFRQALTHALSGTSGTSGTSGNPDPSVQSGSGSSLAMTMASSALAGGPLYRTPRQDSIDGNTVELDAERAQFADNAVRYEASISAVNGKLKSLLAAITGQ